MRASISEWSVDNRMTSETTRKSAERNTRKDSESSNMINPRSKGENQTESIYQKVSRENRSNAE